MNTTEKKLIEKLMLETIDKDEFLRQFPGELVNNVEYFTSLLNLAAQSGDADDLEDVLFLGFTFGLFRKNHLDTLHLLASAQWHHSHENIVMVLEEMRDPSSVDSLYLAAVSAFEYLAFDDNYALSVRCTWALGKIGTTLAKEKLGLLAKSENLILKEAAKFQLERV